MKQSSLPPSTTHLPPDFYLRGKLISILCCNSSGFLYYSSSVILPHTWERWSAEVRSYVVQCFFPSNSFNYNQMKCSPLSLFIIQPNLTLHYIALWYQFCAIDFTQTIFFCLYTNILYLSSSFSPLLLALLNLQINFSFVVSFPFNFSSALNFVLFRCTILFFLLFFLCFLRRN